MYTYLAGHVGHTGEQGAFRALTRGYTHWASGRLQEMEVNTTHPAYCHVRCMMKPLMKVGLYHVYLLLGREGELATICSATCECSAGYISSVLLCVWMCMPVCVHVRACVCARASLHMCICVCTCVPACLPVCVPACVGMCSFVSTYVHMCACVVTL